MKDLIKACVLLFLFVGAGPLLGVAIRSRPSAQRWVFFLMCFMTISGIFHTSEWGLTLHDVAEYRGHSRGFHFYFNEVFAVALIVARFLENSREFRWMPPGLIVYLGWVGLCMVSIVSAPMPLYSLMAAFKALEVVLIFLATVNYLQTAAEVRFMLTSFAITIFWELIASLKAKYIGHEYQVMGTFEHQNALSMYATLIGMVFLGAGVGPKQPRSTVYLMAFLASLWIVECTLSRGGLVAFTIGSVMVMLLSLLDRITVRRLVTVSALAALGVIGAVAALHTILDRFHAEYNIDSAMTRELLNEASRSMLAEKPLGVGWNNYAVVINPPYHYGSIIDDYLRRAEGITEINHNKGISESLYWLSLAENGYEGFAGLMLLFAVFLWFNLRAALRFRDHFLGAVSIGIGVGCISNYLQSTLERVLTQPRNMMEWLLLLALASRIEIWRRQSARAQNAAAPRRMPKRAPASAFREPALT